MNRDLVCRLNFAFASAKRFLSSGHRDDRRNLLLKNRKWQESELSQTLEVILNTALEV